MKTSPEFSQQQINSMLTEGYKTMDKRLMSVERRVHSIEEKMATKDDLEKAVADLQPIRDKASRYEFIVSITRSWKFWGLCLIGLGCVGLAGQRILELLHIIPMTA